MKITLEKITADNYEAVGKLYLPEDQQAQLSPNIWSIADSKFHDSCEARAIYNNETLVGFTMWVRTSEQMTEIWRFMITHKYQRQGLGRRALLTIIEEIKNQNNPEIIEICYSPSNTVAEALYLSSGFKENGMDEEGEEKLAIIDLRHNTKA